MWSLCRVRRGVIDGGRNGGERERKRERGGRVRGKRYCTVFDFDLQMPNVSTKSVCMLLAGAGKIREKIGR
jgi:hypothetical protein